MPLDTNRMVKVLSAGEDALQALRKLIEMIKREYELPGDATSKFENLALMAQEIYLLKEPLETPVILASERAYYNPTRLGINRRARKARAKAREETSHDDE